VAFGSPVAICTLVLALFGITLGALYQSFSHVKEETEFRTQTKDALAMIQAYIRAQQATQVPGKVLNEIAPLSPKEFAQNLPALRAVTEQTPDRVSIKPETLRQVAHKLNETSETTPEYWPTVFQFIRFASAKVSVIEPHGIAIRMDSIHHNIAVQGQTIVFDGAVLIHGRFDKCLIKFTGRPSHFEDVLFTDCVFEFDKDAFAEPSANGRPSHEGFAGSLRCRL
jgi:hypothetical protein